MQKTCEGASHAAIPELGQPEDGGLTTRPFAVTRLAS
jgi:hypothetical protein